MTKENLDNLIFEINKLHYRHELSGKISDDYYEPGMMEYLNESDGAYDSETGKIILRFESKGTRYEGRTEQIEKVNLGDEVSIVRDPKNEFNHNNFLIMTKRNQDIGCMPAELCNVIAPLFDERSLLFEHSEVSYVEPISKRNRHAKQAILFVELRAKLQPDLGDLAPEINDVETEGNDNFLTEESEENEFREAENFYEDSFAEDGEKTEEIICFEEALERYREYCERNNEEGLEPFVGLCFNYIRFARDEWPMFEVLFLKENRKQSLYEVINGGEKKNVLTEIKKLSVKDMAIIESVFIKCFIFANGVANMVHLGEFEIDDNSLHRLLCDAFKTFY